MRIETFLARRYLSSQKGRGLSVITWIALAGVVVGVMSLVTVIAVMSGFDGDLRAKILGNNAHLLVQLVLPIDTERERESLLKEIGGIDGVASVMPIIYGEAFALGPRGGSEGIAIKGVDPALVRKVLRLDDYVRDGNWKAFEEGDLILGDTLARKLGLSPGDSFTLVLNRGELSPLGIMPKMKKLRVADVFHSGMTQYDGHYAYMPMNIAEYLFEMRPKLLEVRVSDLREISKVQKRLEDSVGGIGQVQNWLSLNKDLLSALQLEKIAMSVILGLIILVASFNICGSLIMVVRDKTKDIAILKSMGAMDSTILRIFFLQGAFIGFVGTFVGVVLGILLSLLLRDYIRFPLDPNVYMIDTLPVDLRFWDIFSATSG